jgi:hypothetical protein
MDIRHKLKALLKMRRCSIEKEFNYMRNCLVLLLLLMVPFGLHATNKQPQNIVFILADDLGWNDTNIFQQSQFIETPNIDALASRGMVFSQAYTNSPLCSPTRASI